MAPLDPANTHRMFFDYVTGTDVLSREHTVAVRYNPALRDVSDVQADFLALLQAFGAAAFRANWRVLRARVQAAGSSFSVPVTLIASLGSFLGTFSAIGLVSRFEAVEDTFQGRSLSTGRRVDLSLYRAVGDVDANFRVTAGVSGLRLQVANAVGVLQARSALGSFLAIDNTPPNWYAYMNQNYNSYWESRSRTT